MTSTQTQTLKQNSANWKAGIGLLAAYLLIYAGMLFTMHRLGNFDIAEPLLVLGILGFGFSLAAFLLTIGITPLDASVLKPKQELAAIAAYLLPATAFITWGLDLLRRYVPSAPWTAIVILAAKLMVFVIFPAVMIQALFGYRFGRLAPVSVRPRHLLAMLGMSALLLAFQAVFGSGLREIAGAHLTASTLAYAFPLTFLWLALEVGVVEEFFFRVLLQTRLSAVLKSELGGIVLMSLIFGLAHAPGLYLRTAITQEGLPSHPSLWMAIGYSIVVTSVAGFFLGVLWARTRNFAVVVVVHAMTDLLPNLLPTLRSLCLLH